LLELESPVGAEVVVGGDGGVRRLDEIGVGLAEMDTRDFGGAKGGKIGGGGASGGGKKGKKGKKITLMSTGGARRGA
jgi:hypothetical protein